MPEFRQRLIDLCVRHHATLGSLILLLWAALLVYAIAQALIGQSQGLPQLGR